MRPLQLLLSSALLLLSFGCATTPPTAEEIANADYGVPVSQDDAETKASAYFHNRLKDPMSATYEWQPVYKGWITEAPIYGGHHRFGYRLDGQVNAKNSFGGYTGFKQYWLLFQNGEIVSVYGEDSTPYGGYMMKQL